tara:strand:+ start:160 stop:336 length:177 start_codon:yes stop_codon:yes gene_type:complete
MRVNKTFSASMLAKREQVLNQSLALSDSRPLCLILMKKYALATISKLKMTDALAIFET